MSEQASDSLVDDLFPVARVCRRVRELEETAYGGCKDGLDHDFQGETHCYECDTSHRRNWK